MPGRSSDSHTFGKQYNYVCHESHYESLNNQKKKERKKLPKIYVQFEKKYIHGIKHIKFMANFNTFL